MGIRTVGLLAVVGGVGVTILAGLLVGVTLSAPATRPWDVAKDPILVVAGYSGIVALAVATAGLVFAFQDRISSGGAMAGSIGSVGGIFGLLGAYSLLLALPAGSAILVWDLARVSVLSRWMAAAHVASSFGFALLIAADLSNTPLGVAIVVALFYPLAWLAIGGSILRGVHADPIAQASLPHADRLP
jgi:hypothetical protein